MRLQKKMSFQLLILPIMTQFVFIAMDKKENPYFCGIIV
jgi:hypothetical protein